MDRRWPSVAASVDLPLLEGPKIQMRLPSCANAAGIGAAGLDALSAVRITRVVSVGFLADVLIRAHRDMPIPAVKYIYCRHVVIMRNLFGRRAELGLHG